jgi:DNA-binding FrmR family transcriptional regulator
MAYPYASDKDEILSRLRKVEGQVRGVQRMVDEQGPCVDVLTQISAVISGMEKVGLLLLRDHMHSTLVQAAKAKDPDGKVDEVVKAVERFLQS